MNYTKGGTRAAPNGPVGKFHRTRTACAAALKRLFATLGRTWRRLGDPAEQRYCPTCRNTTAWDPKRGCRECWWADQQL